MHRFRNNGLKTMHSILSHLKPVLTKLLAATPEVTRIIPGEISITKGMGHGKTVGVRITVPLMTADKGTGYKVIALSNGSRQELFVSTSLPKNNLATAFTAAGASVSGTADRDEAEGGGDGIEAASPAAADTAKWR